MAGNRIITLYVDDEVAFNMYVLEGFADDFMSILQRYYGEGYVVADVGYEEYPDEEE